MSNPLRTPVSATMLLGGAGIGLTAITFWLLDVDGPRLADRNHWYVVIALAGFAIELGGAWVHDLQHRRRGETPHAMWGEGDRNRPSWFRARH